MAPCASAISHEPLRGTEKSDNQRESSPSPPPSYSGNKTKRSSLKYLFSCFSSPKTANKTSFRPTRASPLALLPTKANISIALVDLKVSSVRYNDWRCPKTDNMVSMRVSVRPTVTASCIGPDGQRLSATRVGWSTGATASAHYTPGTLGDAIVRATEQATTRAYNSSYSYVAANAIADLEAAFAKKARKALYLGQ